MSAPTQFVLNERDAELLEQLRHASPKAFFEPGPLTSRFRRRRLVALGGCLAIAGFTTLDEVPTSRYEDVFYYIEPTALELELARTEMDAILDVFGDLHVAELRARHITHAVSDDLKVQIARWVMHLEILGLDRLRDVPADRLEDALL